MGHCPEAEEGETAGFHKHLRTLEESAKQRYPGGPPPHPSWPGPYLTRCLVQLLSASLPPSPLSRPISQDSIPFPYPPPNSPISAGDQNVTGWFTTKSRRLTPDLALTIDRLGPSHFTFQELPSSLPTPLRPHFLPRAPAHLWPSPCLGGCAVR